MKFHTDIGTDSECVQTAYQLCLLNWTWMIPKFSCLTGNSAWSKKAIAGKPPEPVRT